VPRGRRSPWRWITVATSIAVLCAALRCTAFCPYIVPDSLQCTGLPALHCIAHTNTSEYTPSCTVADHIVQTLNIPRRALPQAVPITLYKSWIYPLMQSVGPWTLTQRRYIDICRSHIDICRNPAPPSAFKCAGFPRGRGIRAWDLQASVFRAPPYSFVTFGHQCHVFCWP
jgi:hypothetical protein